MKEWLADAGVNLQLTLAGFWGGVVNTLLFRKTSVWEALGIVVTGAVTANYLGDVAVKWTNAPPLATGFIVGLCGAVVCKGLVSGAQTLRFSRGANGNQNDAPPRS